MIILTEEEKAFIRLHSNDAERLINSDDAYDLLDWLDDLILEKGHDKNQDITDVGRSMERIYDNIYSNN